MDGDMKTIEDLGYEPFFESNRVRLGFGGFQLARVISEFKGAYAVKSVSGEYLAKITGKQIFHAVSREDYPAVGDWVAMTKLYGDHASISGVLPRLTVIKRTYGDKNRAGEKGKTQVIAANVNVAFVVESVERDYNLNRFERYFAIVENGGVKPVIVLNKIDLLSKEDVDEKVAQLRNRFPGVDIILTSIGKDESLDELKNRISKGKTYCFLGSSGVGKSSLINALLGGNTIKTGDIGLYSGRGKHCTTTRQMYFLDNGGIVIDNPGTREVGMADTNQDVAATFDEITALAKKCRYADCAHVHEPDCAVVGAVKSGELEKEKYSNYINLRKETGYYGLSGAEKREKDRKFGKFMKKAKKDLQEYKHAEYDV